jgi:ketosteroid isomerase-like protein
MRSEPNLLRCTGCGAFWLSQKGELLTELEEPCLRCGGSLVVEDQGSKNVSVARRLWDAWLSRDLDRFISHCHPEVELRPEKSALLADCRAVYNGHADLRRWFEDAAAAWEAFPGELRAFGDRVLTLGRLVPKRAAGDDAAHAVGWVFQIREGKMLSWRVYLDPEEAVASLQAEVP